MSAPRDANRIPVIQGTSNADDITPVNIGTDPVTRRLLVSGAVTNPSGEELATETTLESIKSTDGIKKITDPIKIEHLSGTGVDTSYTLTNAGTAYYIPRTPPTARYTLIVYNGSDTDMMLGFSSTTTVGFKLVPGEKFMIDLDASELIYAYCASAGKVINFSYKEVV
jgi:hypothetical protein